MKLIEQHPTIGLLKINPAQESALKQWLSDEFEDALSARSEQEALWREMLRLYEAVPKHPVKNTPIENAPNTQIPLGAIAADSIYAQAVDLIYTISPIVTIRATNERFTQQAKAFQRFTDFVTTNESGIRIASDDVFLDDVQLGTGVYYIPWVETLRKTKSSRLQERSPCVVGVPIEDFIVPGGAKRDLHKHRWVAYRTWLSPDELSVRAKLRGWNTDGIVATGSIGWVRNRRETLGRTTSNKKIGVLYEIIDLYGEFDIDGDGIPEDLLITWDRSSRKLMKIRYQPYDHRPFESMVYQPRAHLFYGIGIVEMEKPFQEETTEIHNSRVLNMLLANCRFWISKTGTFPSGFKIWPNRNVEVSDPANAIKAEAMADVYPSSQVAETIAISLAERRVGAGEIVSSPSQLFGSRTPGITAISALQQVNKRFTPAFDSMRLGTASAIKQCMFRYQERLLMGDLSVEEHIRKFMGERDGQAVISVLKDPLFDEGMAVELTASSVSINKEADRQNAILLTNLLMTYYQKALELTMLASNPATPQPVRDVAIKVAKSAGEIIDRTIRTFDQIRDPGAFVVDFTEQIDQTNAPGMGLQGLGNVMAALQEAGAGGEGTNGSAPPT